MDGRSTVSANSYQSDTGREEDRDGTGFVSSGADGSALMLSERQHDDAHSGGGGGGGLESEELRFRVLDANSQAIYLTQCRDLDAAEQLLIDTYNHLVLISQDDEGAQGGEQGNTSTEGEGTGGGASGTGAATTGAASHHDARLVSLLKATTLNNIAFVIYHRGTMRQALAHLELAQALEAACGVQSPALAINLCVVHNAVGNYELSSQHALSAIDALRRQTALEAAAARRVQLTQLAEQRAGGGGGGGSTHNNGTASYELLVATGLAPGGAEERRKLWGAAWHNLGIAQLQLADPSSPAENTHVRHLFENAMAATTELLGRRHPMTRAVVDTFRAVRKELQERGAFKTGRGQASVAAEGLPCLRTFHSDAMEAATVVGYSANTGRRVPAASARAVRKVEAKQIPVVLRAGGGSNAVHVAEMIDAEPYTTPRLIKAAPQPPSGRPTGTRGGGGDGCSPRTAQDQAVSSRQLSRGAPALSPRMLPDEVRRLRSEGAAPSATTTRGYLTQASLRNVVLKGNFALAGALYANPHPLAGNTVPRLTIGPHRSVALPPLGNLPHLQLHSGRAGSRSRPPSSPTRPPKAPAAITSGGGTSRPQAIGYSVPVAGAAFQASAKGSRQTSGGGGGAAVPRPPSQPRPDYSGRGPALIADMWVEAPAAPPRNSSPNSVSSLQRTGPNDESAAARQAAYSRRAEHVREDQRVIEPSHYAHRDATPPTAQSAVEEEL